MNRKRLTEILNRHHPDKNGGSNAHAPIVRAAIALYQRDRKERKCACGNGKSRVSKRCSMCALKVKHRGRLKLVTPNDKLRHSAPAEDSDNTKNV